MGLILSVWLLYWTWSVSWISTLSKKLFIWGENDSAKLSSVIKDVFASLSFSFGTIRILVASNKVFLTH
jgi:hypothetical protein